MEQKPRSKFLRWPGKNRGPWHLAAADVATRLPRTLTFSRLLRHAGGYSKTILTPNLQGTCTRIMCYITSVGDRTKWYWTKRFSTEGSRTKWYRQNGSNFYR